VSNRPQIAPAYLGLRELVAYSGLSERTLRGCLNDPEFPLPCYRARGRGRVLVKVEEFDVWLSRWRSEGSARAQVDGILAELCDQMQPGAGQRH
jgi:hypothetical protein